jgi:hypothetical protein
MCAYYPGAISGALTATAAWRNGWSGCRRTAAWWWPRTRAATRTLPAATTLPPATTPIASAPSEHHELDLIKAAGEFNFAVNFWIQAAMRIKGNRYMSLVISIDLQFCGRDGWQNTMNPCHMHAYVMCTTTRVIDRCDHPPPCKWSIPSVDYAVM